MVVMERRGVLPASLPPFRVPWVWRGIHRGRCSGLFHFAPLVLGALQVGARRARVTLVITTMYVVVFAYGAMELWRRRLPWCQVMAAVSQRRR